MALAAALLAAGLLPAATALAAGSTCGGSGVVTTQTGTLADGATYKIECPGGPWNGSQDVQGVYSFADSTGKLRPAFRI